MTEEEAKTKWCFAAVASHTNPREGFDGQKDRKPIFNCIGSKCMAWRSEIVAHDIQPIGRTLSWHAGFQKRGDPIPDEYTGEPMQEWVALEGFCGLAGKP